MHHFISKLELTYLSFSLGRICSILLTLRRFGLLAHPTLEYLLWVLNIKRMHPHRTPSFLHPRKANQLINIILQSLQLEGKEIHAFLPLQLYLHISALVDLLALLQQIGITRSSHEALRAFVALPAVLFYCLDACLFVLHLH